MLLDHDAPALNMTDPGHCSPGRVPLARIQTSSWNRIRRLLFVGSEGLLPKALLERGGPLSRHHALRDIGMTVGKVRPLGRLVRSVTGRRCPSQRRQSMRWHITDGVNHWFSPWIVPTPAGVTSTGLKFGHRSWRREARLSGREGGIRRGQEDERDTREAGREPSRNPNR